MSHKVCKVQKQKNANLEYRYLLEVDRAISLTSKLLLFSIYTSFYMSTLYRQPDGSESPLLPPELCLLISDCLEAPATFLIAQQVAQAIKAKRRVALFGLSQSFDYYNAILRKQVRLCSPS